MDKPPHYRTGALWGVLTVLLFVGTLASAFFVYGLTDLFATGRYLFDVPILMVGAFTAGVALLLIVGVLYRVDRLRGVPHRRVELFD
jgi:hypothetical protein